MFVVFGSRVITLTVGVGKFHCPHCAAIQSFKHLKRTRFFTLYFIPVFPMGEIDQRVECGHCGTAYNSNVLRNHSPGFVYEARHPVLNVAVIVAAVVVVLLGLSAVSTVISNNRAAEQRAAVAATNQAVIANYGSANLNTCMNGVSGPSSTLTLPKDVHFIAVSQDDSTILSAYQQLIPTAEQAHDKTDLTHVICLHLYDLETDVHEYGDKVTQEVFYRCSQYQKTVDAWIVELKSGRHSQVHIVKGTMPADCPSKVGENLFYYGDPVNPAEVIQALDIH